VIISSSSFTKHIYLFLCAFKSTTCFFSSFKNNSSYIIMNLTYQIVINNIYLRHARGMLWELAFCLIWLVVGWGTEAYVSVLFPQETAPVYCSWFPLTDDHIFELSLQLCNDWSRSSWCPTITLCYMSYTMDSFNFNVSQVQFILSYRRLVLAY